MENTADPGAMTTRTARPETCQGDAAACRPTSVQPAGAYGLECACGGRIVTPDGEMVCETCGMVAGYEAVAAPGNMAATPPAYFDGGLRTTIGRADADYTGRAVHRPGTTRRMRKRDLWSQKYRRSIPAGMTQLSKLHVELNMTEACAEYAAYLFRKAVSAGFLVGRKTTHCTAASALLACRAHGISRTMDDVVRATGVAKRDIFRMYRRLYERFDPELPVPDPVSFIARIAGEVGVSEAARRGAQAILDSMDRSEMAGKDPMGLAAGVLYLACVNRGEAVRRRDIAEAAGVAETTLSTHFNTLAASA